MWKLFVLISFLLSGCIIPGDVFFRNFSNRTVRLQATLEDHRRFEKLPNKVNFYDTSTKDERNKLIQDCFNQLKENGVMVFTTITKAAQTYGQGTLIDKDRFEMFGGMKIFFYEKKLLMKNLAMRDFLK